MTRRDVLLDQLPQIVAFAAATGFLILVVHLGVSPLTWGVAGYVLLLAATTLAAVLVGAIVLELSGGLRGRFGRLLDSE